MSTSMMPHVTKAGEMSSPVRIALQFFRIVRRIATCAAMTIALMGIVNLVGAVTGHQWLSQFQAEYIGPIAAGGGVVGSVAWSAIANMFHLA